MCDGRECLLPSEKHSTTGRRLPAEAGEGAAVPGRGCASGEPPASNRGGTRHRLGKSAEQLPRARIKICAWSVALQTISPVANVSRAVDAANALLTALPFGLPGIRPELLEDGAPTKTGGGWGRRQRSAPASAAADAPAEKLQTRDGWAASSQGCAPSATDPPGSMISRAPLPESSGALSFRRPGGPFSAWTRDSRRRRRRLRPRRTRSRCGAGVARMCLPWRR
jgi:hypothetical protein